MLQFLIHPWSFSKSDAVFFLANYFWRELGYLSYRISHSLYLMVQHLSHELIKMKRN